MRNTRINFFVNIEQGRKLAIHLIDCSFVNFCHWEPLGTRGMSSPICSNFCSIKIRISNQIFEEKRCLHFCTTRLSFPVHTSSIVQCLPPFDVFAACCLQGLQGLQGLLFIHSSNWRIIPEHILTIFPIFQFLFCLLKTGTNVRGVYLRIPS